MFSLMMGLGGLSAGLCFKTGFASGFVEELGGGFESCAIVQPPQEQVRQITLIKCPNLKAILPFSVSVLSHNQLDDVFASYDQDYHVDATVVEDDPRYLDHASPSNYASSWYCQLKPCKNTSSTEVGSVQLLGRRYRPPH